jgi:hypothetical protein
LRLFDPRLSYSQTLKSSIPQTRKIGASAVSY